MAPVAWLKNQAGCHGYPRAILCVQFVLESLSSFNQKPCPVSSGIHVQFQLETLSSFDRNTHVVCTADPVAAKTGAPATFSVWARNRLNRIVKTPKLQFIDSGLLAAVLNLDLPVVQQNRARFGSLLETFVYSELLKLATYTQASYNLLYYRDADQFEVDLVLENSSGQIVGVEVKAAASVQEGDLRGLKKLASLAGPDFKMGVILYDGTETLPLGPAFWAVPISSLWGAAP